MNKFFMVLGFALGILIFPGVLFAGGAEESKDATVTVANKTKKATIARIEVFSSDKKLLGSADNNIPNGRSIDLSLPKGDKYEIVATDTQNHRYAKECFVGSNTNTLHLEILESDFKSEGWWDELKKAAGF